jgi:hypothetical protein
MQRAEADRLVAELGRYLGLPDLALDEGGTCTLLTEDGALAPTLGHNRATGTIDLMICLDGLRPGDTQLRSLLTANFGTPEGHSFALLPATGALVLQRRCAPHELGGGLLPPLTRLIAAADRLTGGPMGTQAITTDTATTIAATVLRRVASRGIQA